MVVVVRGVKGKDSDGVRRRGGGKGRKERRLFNIRYDSEKDKVSSTREIGEFIKLERERDREEEELIGDCDEQGYGEVVVVQSVNFMVGHFLLFKLMVMMGCVPVLFWGKTKNMYWYSYGENYIQHKGGDLSFSSPI